MLQRLKPEATCWSSVGFGQQVAGQLLDRELVERLVVVEGVDHPVAVGPDLAVVVDVDAVRVGVAGGVEPVAAAMLAPVRRSQQLIDVLLVSASGDLGSRRREPGPPRRPGRRQAGQVEADAAGQRAAIGFGSRLQARRLPARPG